MGPRHGVLMVRTAAEIGEYDAEQRAAARNSEDFGLIRGRLLSSWGPAIGKLLADQYFDGQQHRNRQIMAAALGDSLVRNPQALRALVESLVPELKEKPTNDC